MPNSNHEFLSKNLSYNNQLNTSNYDVSRQIKIVHEMEAKHAVQYNNILLLRNFLDSGKVSVDAADSDDCTLLHWAAINNRLEIAKLLIERKCNLNPIGGVLSATPLHWATHYGHNDMVQLLVQNKADYMAFDGEGFTPLHIAAQFKWTKIAAFFVAYGQSPDVPDVSGKTPAMWCCIKVHNVHPLRMFALMGADLEKIENNFGNTALHWAVASGNYVAIQSLIDLNVNLEPINKQKETPLDIAKRKNDLLAVRLLESALRKKGLRAFTCKQTFEENKKIAFNIAFFLPFSITFLSGCIFNASLNYILKLQLFLLLGIINLFFYKFFAKKHYEETIQAFLFGVAISNKLFFTGVWITFLHPIVPFIFQILFFIFLFVIPFLSYKLIVEDPGFVKVTHQERCEMILEMMKNKDLFESFCPICVILMSSSTKHCRICDHCVILMDHHCPFVKNCIGKKNYKIFFVYIVCIQLIALIVFISCFYYYYENCGQWSYFSILFCKPWIVQLHFLSTIIFLWTFLICCIQIFWIFILKMNPNRRHQRCRPFHFAGKKINLCFLFCLNIFNNLCTVCCIIKTADKKQLINSSFEKSSFSKKFETKIATV